MVADAGRTGHRYTRGAIAFHWTIAAAILFNLWLGLFHESLPGNWRVMPVHKALGITVLVLSLARLGWRLAHRPPPFPPALPRWERTLAKTAHWTLYALMIGVPLSGWLMVSGAAVRRPLDWFGLFPLPFLPVGPSVGGAAHEAHELLGYATAALLLVHILAALRHHLILRDDTLVRILPRLRTSQPH
ncbi:cytochrome b561 [Sphingomonas guangdongensis]|uniref:Cytochrome b561 n=1 Tax=Sphingomonas guangdongensis TaxID=1141890 RepID=A0A285R217_9SPHN|nr:cytochrome b [Sphingomonas guangdongensis]SOB88156.1 cytochrome b561 [Sphingomonas guangdongensis]